MHLSDYIMFKALFPASSEGGSISDGSYFLLEWNAGDNTESIGGIYKLSDQTPSATDLADMILLIDDGQLDVDLEARASIEDNGAVVFVNSPYYPDSAIALIVYEEIEGTSPGFYIYPRSSTTRMRILLKIT